MISHDGEEEGFDRLCDIPHTECLSYTLFLTTTKVEHMRLNLQKLCLIRHVLF
jgi:hypothetical protein